MFRYQKQDVVQIYFEDKHINELPVESQLKLIKDCFPFQKIKKSDIIDYQVNYSCILLVGMNMYSFSCIFVSIDEEYCCMDKIKIMPFLLDSIKSEEKESNVENGMEESKKEKKQENETKVPAEQAMHSRKELPPRWNKKVMNFLANLGRTQIKEIMEIDPSFYEVHNIDEMKQMKNKEYPYIYYNRERYNVCFSTTKTIDCRTELIAKLLVYYETDESRKNLLLELDEEEGIEEEMIRYVLYRKSDELKEMLKYINAKVCLNILKNKEQAK